MASLGEAILVSSVKSLHLLGRFGMPIYTHYAFYYYSSVSPQQMEVLQRSFDFTQSILHKFIEHLSILPPPRDTIY